MTPNQYAKLNPKGAPVFVIVREGCRTRYYRVLRKQGEWRPVESICSARIFCQCAMPGQETNTAVFPPFAARIVDAERVRDFRRRAKVLITDLMAAEPDAIQFLNHKQTPTPTNEPTRRD